jgi:hypothetical protein
MCLDEIIYSVANQVKSRHARLCASLTAIDNLK